MNCEGPKFCLGDLVWFTGDYFIDLVDGLGIIVAEPRLALCHDWKGREDFPNEFWTYDIKVGNQLFKMVPEQFLKRLNDEN